MAVRHWKLGLLLATTLALGCQSPRDTSNKETEVVLDPSGSRVLQKEETSDAITGFAENWVEKASNGDRLQLFAFSATNPYGYEKLFSYTMRLTIPAYKARRPAKEQVREGISQALEKISWTTHSPIFEILNLFGDNFGSLGSRHRRVVYFTDLMQNSKNLSFQPKALAKRKDEEVLAAMRQICPTPVVVPEQVVFYCFPGLENPKKAVEIDLYRRVRTLYQRFFKEWTGSQVTFTNLEEGGRAR